MTLRVAVLGITGRLGGAIAREVLSDPRFALTGGIVRSEFEGEDRDIGVIAGAGRCGIAASVSLEEGTANADLLIDASQPEATIAAAERLAGRGNFAFVTGVTGLDSDQKARLQAASDRLPILAARNFSLGIALMDALVRKAAAALPAGAWDAEITETHHRHKVDAPSGTALVLGEAVAAGRQQALDDVAAIDRAGKRRPGDIGFSVTRGGGIIGEHAVRFLSEMEEITLSHTAHDRRVFARGALEAALWMSGRKPGLYSMADLVATRT